MKSILQIKIVFTFFFISALSFAQTFNATLNANLTAINQPGETIIYTVTITNTPNSTIEYQNISVNGSAFVNDFIFVSGDLNSDSIINIGETWVYETSFYVGQNVFDNNGIPVGSDELQYESLVNATEIGGVDVTFQLNWNAILILTDTDGDGVTDLNENIDNTDPNNGCDFDPNHITRSQSSSWFVEDCDNDGISNEMEFFSPTTNHDTDGDNVIDILDIDDDGDGIYTLFESDTDIDGDQIPNYLDLDSDNDLIPDNVEMQGTNDYVLPNGIVNNEGLDTAYSLGNSANLINSDTDNLYDYIDTDSDNDGILDVNESGLSSSSDDNDNDGLNDGADADLNGYGTPNGMINNPVNDLTNSDTTSNEVDYREVAVITCFEVSNITFQNILATSAAMNWDTNNTPHATSWTVEIVLSGTTPTGQGTIVTANLSDFTGLQSDQSYDVYVRANCAVSDSSNWVMGTFTTLNNTSTTLTCGDIFTDSGNINGNYSNSEDSTTIICPDVVGEAVTVTFTSFNIEANFDVLKIYDGDDANAILLGEFDGTDLPPTFTASTASGCLTFVFQSDYTLTRDGWEANVTCAPLPTCLPVTQITANSISEFIVAIAFQENNTPNATEWEIEYGLSGFTQGNGTTFTSPSQNLSIGNLTPSTMYDVYVRVNCGNGDYSTWTMLTFETMDIPCNVATGDEQQVFDATTNPTVADIVVQTSVQGETVLIFDVADCNATPLDITTPLSNGATYYAFQGVCCDDFLTIQVELNTPVMDYPYNVAQIPFQIYGQPLPDTMNMDDAFTDLIPLTFNFNYFGLNYNQISIGTNSVISFDASDAGNFCDWDINADQAIPNTQLIDNAILGAYQDYDNRGGMAGTQGYGFIGTAPFRKFVVFFDDVELYNTNYCAGIRSTNQMILYESYNYIDVQVLERNVCTNWNEGNAVIGIQNIGGTEAYFPTNRNVGDWYAQNEGYRFKPELDVLDFQLIICDPEVDGVEIFDLNTVLNHFNTGTNNITYSIHESKADADNNVNPISGNYTNTSNSQRIFVREDDTVVGEITIKTVLLATIDCTADYDLDTVSTADEDLNGNGNYGDDDTDGDAIPDFIDEDDDGDFVLTEAEAVVTNNRSRNSTTTTNYMDTDGDQIPNYLDNDDDGDGVLTINEDYDGDMNPGNDDTNNDGIMDYLQQSVALGTSNNTIHSFAIFPNPTKDNLTIEFESQQVNIDIKIFSVNGQEVYTKQKITGTSLTIDVSQLSSGIYLITILNDDKTRIQKFVKE